MPRRSHSPAANERELDRRVVFVTTWVASVFAVGLAVIGLVGGADVVLTRAMVPATIALAGWVMMEFGRPSVAIQLFVGMGGVSFMVVTGDGNYSLDPLFGFMAMAVTGAVFVRRFIVWFIGTATVGLALIGYWHGDPLETASRIQTAFGSAVTYVFLAWLIVWLKGQWLESQQELHELIRSKDELVASISHELRTPMTTVVGLSRELDERFADFDPNEVEEFVGLIVQESCDVANILEVLLVAARAEIDTLSLDMRPIELAATIGAALPGAPQVAIEGLENAGPIEVLADAGRVRQILRNLVVNAARYGGPRMRIVVERRGGVVAVAVRDNGGPIPPDDRDRIFEAYRTRAYGTNVPGSVGLGLTVSRDLARLMGGDLVYDHDGIEASFTLTLPLVTVSGDRSDTEVEVTPLAM